jgi:hypothetical protein
MPKIVLTKNKIVGNYFHVLITEEKGFSLLPRAHQMCESVTILVELAFTHNFQIS